MTGMELSGRESNMAKISPLFVLWAGLSLAAVALFAEAFRGASPAPAAPVDPVATRTSPPPVSPGPGPVPPIPAPGVHPASSPGAPAGVPAPPSAPFPVLPPVPESGPPPRIELAGDTADFGVILQGAEMPHVFTVHNRGEGPLRLIEAIASCGCAAVMPDRREIPPGESGEIKILFRSGSYVGPQHKTISLRTNDPARPVSILHMKADVKPLFLFDPVMLNIGEMKRGEQIVREVTVRETQGKPFTVESVQSTSTYVKGEMLPEGSEGGAVRRLRVTVTAEGIPGGFVGHLAVRVNRPGVIPVLVVQGVLSGNVSIFPQSLFLGMVRQDQAFPLQSLVLRARGDAPIAVKSVDTGVPWLKAEVKTVVEGRTYQIDLTVDPTPPPGRFEQVVRITTSDPPPPYAVTLSGVVRKVETEAPAPAPAPGAAPGTPPPAPRGP